MAKRKLSIQQSRRLSEKRKLKLGDDAAILLEGQLGLVITNFGKKVLIETETGEPLSCSIRQHLGKLSAGDRVLWQPGKQPSTAVIDQLQERKNLLQRPGFRGEMRLVAANISQIGIVVPILPGIHPDMIDRYLVAAAQLELTPFIILNKVDLIEEPEHWQAVSMMLQPYVQMGIEIVRASSLSEHGLDQLSDQLDQQISVLVGASGAGKSSLINALIPDLELRIGALSETTGLGNHTTSNSILYHLPTGGDLIDSPGVRLFSPQPCSLSELEQYYADFQPYLGQCKFNNCTHQHEPKCAIVQAVDDQLLDAQRLHSFHRLLEEFESS